MVKTMKIKKQLTIYFKFVIGMCAILAVILACLFAVRDGYSHWSKRLLYFTQQSNIWIGVTSLVLAILYLIEKNKNKILIKEYMYTFKYIFTVSITITGIIFCTLLAPFADFDIWTSSSILTHIVVPVLSIIDFFIDDKEIVYKKKHIFLSLIPPLIYFVFAEILCILKVDFGRGDPYPYFFMDFYAEAGLFGYINSSPPQLGTMYWIIIIMILIISLGYLYYSLHSYTRKNRKQLNSKTKKAV